MRWISNHKYTYYQYQANMILAMVKEEFIQLVEIERAKFDAVVEKLRENNDFLTPVNDNWLVKDVIAHIVWYEREIITLINSRSMTNNADIWNNPVEVRNRLVYDMIKDLRPQQVIDEYHQTGKELIKLLKEMDPQMYTDSSLYEAMPSDWSPHVVIRGNTYTHYPDHHLQLANKFAYLK